MGCCLSKKNPGPNPVPSKIPQIQQNDDKVTSTQKLQSNVTAEIEVECKVEERNELASVIQQRKSNSDVSGLNSSEVKSVDKCTKEEVDDILIQCGKLSRTPSGNEDGKRYSGSKRSFDFDSENHEERSRDVSSGRVSKSPVKGSHSGNGSVGSRRRVSRSPRRRSESPMSHSGNGMVGKLVSVPPTVTSLSIEKGMEGNGGESGNRNGKRVSFSRNGRLARSQSPANRNQLSVSQFSSPVKRKSVSRKMEQSPYKRTPLNEIDNNSFPFNPPSNSKRLIKGKDVLQEKKYPAETDSVKTAIQGSHRRTGNRGAEEFKGTKTNYDRNSLNEVEYEAMVTPTLPGTETLRLPQTSVKTTSDINGAFLTPTPTNYTSFLLNEKSNSNSDSISPVQAILEAVADLNSTTRLDLDNPKKKPADLHKYVTVRKRGGGMINDDESSGSNSIVGGQENWVSPSKWELNSADSTDCWTSKSYSPVGYQRHAISDLD